jgi:glutamate dehydrogenase
MNKPTLTLPENVAKALSNKKASKELTAFAQLYLDDLPKDELADLNDDAIIAHLKDIHTFLKTNNGTDVLHLRVHNPSYTENTVIESLAKDQPFLLSSLWAELERQDIPVRFSIHPIISLQRNASGQMTKLRHLLEHDSDTDWDKESLIHIEIPPLPKKADRDALAEHLQEAIHQAQWSVEDFPAIIGRMIKVVATTENNLKRTSENGEKLKFLHWLINGNFIFLGYRHYKLNWQGKNATFELNKGQSMGTLRDESKSSISKPQPFSKLAPNIQRYLSNDDFLIVTKALTKSRVHRRVDMDYIGIKEFDKSGRVIGEHRFVGLFTSKAYNTNPMEIPIVGHKIKQILAESAPVSRGSYNYKSLVNILLTFPKDELFQASLEELNDLAHGVLALQERPQVKLFVRRCNHERMISTLVYLPRDRMNSQVRTAIQNRLMDVFNGEAMEWQVTVGTQQLANIYIRIRTAPPEPPQFDVERLEQDVRNITITWADKLEDALNHLHKSNTAYDLFKRYGSAFTPSYQAHNLPIDAVQDIHTLERILKQKESFAVTIKSLSNKCDLSIKIFNYGQNIELSRIIPPLENLGLYITTEQPSVVRLSGEEPIWLHEFQASTSLCDSMQDSYGDNLKAAISGVWHNELEDDRLGALIFAGLDIQQIIIMRGLSAYMHQLGRRFTKDYVHQTLIKHPRSATKLIELFDARMNPKYSKEESEKRAETAEQELNNALKSVMVLDEDRILRRMLHVIRAVVRTNLWQRENITDPLSFKIRSGDIPDIVRPAPLFEIFVYHHTMEGVHLRGGKVARGGLRWSDRPQDFRTEVLGLVKAQMIKNAVIVPEGSKGGFVLKGPQAADRSELQKQVVSAYKTFICGLLCLTDNLVDGKIVPPVKVKRLDEDDPYLVVAADKGTATFSDIANGLSQEAMYWGKRRDHNEPITGFWLDDAFASGGSNGYDHKKMGITARGAWECVKYHFRQLGKDIQTEPFTAVGIGDMGGDVFGNGMLLSKQTKLVAAFNHLHIFLDPNPDPEKSHAERARLFANPGKSGWNNYNTKLISEGGGVFSRSEKSIPLSKEIRKALGTKLTATDPNTLISLILKAPVELWWNGGIGTFVKASTENSMTVGDRANDDIRVNACDVAAQVIGEGGNLGFTQRARIEFALKGGRIHTDSIDNAAGVNTSDHEVNIKILLADAQATNGLTLTKRNKLLEEMTEDVAQQVLTDNFLQAQALALKLRAGSNSTDVNFQLQKSLEQSGQMDAALEALPTPEELERRKRLNLGYTSPELSILIAYAKIDIYRDLLESDLPDDPALKPVLEQYFPPQLQRKYKELMQTHQLKREIVATVVANDVVNRMGLTFINRLRTETGNTTPSIVRAYLIAKSLFNAPAWWQEIEGLGSSVSGAIQLELLDRVKDLLEFNVVWLLAHAPKPLDLASTVARYKKSFGEIVETMPKHLSTYLKTYLKGRAKSWVSNGLPANLAEKYCQLGVLANAADVADLCLAHKLPVNTVLAAYFKLDDNLGIAQLHNKIRDLPAANNWQRIANQTIIEDLHAYHHRITSAVLSMVGSGTNPVDKAYKDWLQQRASAYAQYQNLHGELNAAKAPSQAMLSVIVGQIKSLCR